MEEEAAQWAEEYEKQQQHMNTESINKRMAVFKKNEEITG